MDYTKEQLRYVLAYLEGKEPRRATMSAEVPGLNLDGNHGSLTGYSNKAWNYGTTGLSFYYSYGNDHAPGSICGHNICMCISRISQDFYCDGYFHDSPENQQTLRNMFINTSSLVYQVSIAKMLEDGKAIVAEKNKQQAWTEYCEYIKTWAEDNRSNYNFPKPKTFTAWRKENK